MPPRYGYRLDPRAVRPARLALAQPASRRASDALDQLDEAYERRGDGVRGLGADGLLRPCGPAEGAFAAFPLASLILHINREAIHHGAEIALLRDLYRAEKLT